MSEAVPLYYPFSLRPGADLGEQLATRGNSNGATAKRDLARYYRLLVRELARVKFTMPEVEVILTVVGARHDLDAEELLAMPLWAIVDDWIEQAPSPRYRNVDRRAFISKLRALSAGAVVAIVDAVDRFRRSPMGAQGALGRTEALRAVGLLHPDDPAGRYVGLPEHARAATRSSTGQAEAATTKSSRGGGDSAPRGSSTPSRRRRSGRS